jgi:hypothetical protein
VLDDLADVGDEGVDALVDGVGWVVVAAAGEAADEVGEVGFELSDPAVAGLEEGDEAGGMDGAQEDDDPVEMVADRLHGRWGLLVD